MIASLRIMGAVCVGSLPFAVDAEVCARGSINEGYALGLTRLNSCEVVLAFEDAFGSEVWPQVRTSALGVSVSGRPLSTYTVAYGSSQLALETSAKAVGKDLRSASETFRDALHDLVCSGNVARFVASGGSVGFTILTLEEDNSDLSEGTPSTAAAFEFDNCEAP
jgi:hypothetical protein